MLFRSRDLQRYMNAIDEGKWPLMVLTKEAEGKVLFKDIQCKEEVLDFMKSRGC